MVFGAPAHHLGAWDPKGGRLLGLTPSEMHWQCTSHRGIASHNVERK